MHFQAALHQPGLKLSFESLRFLLVTAVHQSIVRIPTPREVRMSPHHPEIKRVVQKDVGQNWADYPSYTIDNFDLERRIKFERRTWYRK